MEIVMQSATQNLSRFEAGPRTTRAIVHNGTVYLGGQVAKETLNGSVADQIREALASVDDLLTKAGTDKTRVLHATVYLRDLADFHVLNTVWDDWVVPGAAPTRATVGATLALPEMKVEIVVTAAV